MEAHVKFKSELANLKYQENAHITGYHKINLSVLYVPLYNIILCALMSCAGAK